MRGATAGINLSQGIVSHFNPRSPCGERPAWNWLRAGAGHISIHAPRAGSDRSLRVAENAKSEFQSTLPVRGATYRRQGVDPVAFISIHAPRAGSDPDSPARPRAPFNFNPRSPCGERQRTNINHALYSPLFLAKRRSCLLNRKHSAFPCSILISTLQLCSRLRCEDTEPFVFASPSHLYHQCLLWII